MRRLLLVALLLAPVIGVWRTGTAVGQTFSVSSEADAGPGTFRQAVLDAAGSGADATIEIAPDLSIALTGSEVSFAPAGSTALTIDGNGSTIQRVAGAGRLLNDLSSAALTIANTRLLGGTLVATSASGGALRVNGDLTLTSAVVEGSATAGGGGAGEGGAIFSNGTITMTDTQVTGTADGGPGGLAFGGAARARSVTATRSTITGTATAGGFIAGGALEADNITVDDSVVTGNASGHSGSGFGSGAGFRGGALDADLLVDVSDSRVIGAVDVHDGGEGLGGAIHSGSEVHVAGSVIRGMVDVHSGAQGGFADGGAIMGSQLVDIDHSDVSGSIDAHGTNHGGVARGGAVFAGDGDPDLATITNSQIHDSTLNASGADGGGTAEGAAVWNEFPLQLAGVTITTSDAVANGAGGLAAGGGLFTRDKTRAVSSTITGNTTQGDAAHGGGIFGQGPLELAYDDIVGNDAATGANVATAPLPLGPDLPTTLTTFGTVFTEPTRPASNCDGYTTVISTGYNFADDTSCSLIQRTDVHAPGADPLLSPLAGNGGPTETLLPQRGSPLIDAIPTGACQTTPASAITNDQRGFPRPEAPDGACDVGAVEIQLPPTPVPPPAGPPLAIQPRFTG